MRFSYQKRILFVVFLTLSLFFIFLYFSRVPDLNTKSNSDPLNILDTAFTHDPFFYLKKENSLLLVLLKHFLNWLGANYKGMIFGIFLGAAAKNLFRYIQFKKNKGPFFDSFIGLISGSPLSICVNCSAPVMKGILSSKKEVLALSLMMSSPSMNFIVLTMLFSLLPFYLVSLKILFNLTLILIILPLISLKIGKRKIEGIKKTGEEEGTKTRESWESAIKMGVKRLLEDFSFIFKKTVPLMIAAAFFAALLITFIDQNSLQSLNGDSLFVLSVVTLLGILLPVPIAIDILLVVGLFAIGLDINLILALLCTLGISSIYSLAIVWRYVSPKWCIYLFFSIFILSMIFASAAKFIEKTYILGTIKYSSMILKNHEKVTAQSNLDFESPLNISLEESTKNKLLKNKISWKLDAKQENLKIYRSQFEKQDSKISQRFSKLEGEEIGFNKTWMPNNNDIIIPFWFRGIASGDIDQDGWDDLVFGSNQGPLVYKNLNGAFYLWESDKTNSLFDKIPLSTFIVALVDLNNDNYPELFFSTWSKGNYLIPNIKGTLRHDLIKEMPNGDSILTISSGFADFDGNEYIDIVNGNTLSIPELRRKEIPGERQNFILYNNSKFQFREKTLKSYQNGDTLSTLIADFNKDGLPDILFGNDFSVSDYLHINKGKGFQISSLPSFGIKEIPRFSMSHNIGDLNNDLNEDLFMSGTIAEKYNYSPSKEYSISKWSKKRCLDIKDKKKLKNCLNLMSLNHLKPLFDVPSYYFGKCLLLNDFKTDCLANNLIKIIGHPFFESYPINCNIFTNRFPYFKTICEFYLKAVPLKKVNETNTNLIFPNQIRSNNIYMGKESNIFEKLPSEKDNEMIYPKVPGWTWNSQIADYDNDGLQDIFIVNGSLINEQNGPNYFLKNDKNKFSVKTFEYNLNDIFNYHSFIPIDFDNDGDLDIITNSSEGPVRVYKNNHGGKNSLSIRFQSKHGTENFISTKVILRNKETGKKFMRRIQKSGGFLSFPSKTLHFGLGEGKESFSIEIIWPSGKTDQLNIGLKRGYQYLVVKE